jgi:pyruvoyl-dependent arginine decarboxylase (PvlArgDC)
MKKIVSNVFARVATTGLACLLSTVVGVAIAQDATKPAATAEKAAAPVAATEKAIEAPKHGCKKPENPGKLASERQQATFRKEIDGYRDCLTAYREQMNKTAKVVEAANGAIQEFNDYVTELNASVKK